MIGNKIEPFKFWCQKVLPNVYDDSLSYYEYLCKLNEYLNDVIEQINTLTDNMSNYETDLTAQWTTYRDELSAQWQTYKTYIDTYFDNLDVQQEINNKLNAMASDGTLDNLIQPYVISEIPSQVTAWLEENVDPVGSAVIVDNSLSVSGAAADAKVTGGNIEYLNDNDNNIVNAIKSIIEDETNIYKPYFVLGNIDLSNGALSDSLVRYRTNDYFIPLGNPTSFKIYAPSTVEIGRVYYNNGSYTAYYNWTAPNASGFISQTNQYDAYKLVVRHSDGTEVTEAEIKNVYISYEYEIDAITTNKLTEILSAIMHPKTKYSYRNFFKSGVYTNGNTYTENGGYRCLLLDVKEGEVYHIWGVMKYNFIHMVSIYDDSSHLLAEYNVGGDPEITYSDTTITIPKNGSKMYCSAYVVDPQKYQFDLYKYEHGRVTQWNNKYASFVGDSITEGVYWNGSTLVNSDYPYTFYLPDLMQLRDIENKGASGTTIADNPAHSSETWLWMKNRITEMDSDADLAVMFGGTNDYGLNTPMGTIGSADTTTFYGALNNCATLMLNKYKQKFSRKKIVWMTPLHRLGDNNNNTEGLKLIDYVNAIKAVAQKFAIDVIDLYSESGFTGISSLSDYALLSSDGLHPTEILGYQRLGEIIAEKLNNI